MDALLSPETAIWVSRICVGCVGLIIALRFLLPKQARNRIWALYH